MSYEELKMFDPKAAERRKAKSKIQNDKYKNSSDYQRIKKMEEKFKKFK